MLPRLVCSGKDLAANLSVWMLRFEQRIICIMLLSVCIFLLKKLLWTLVFQLLPCYFLAVKENSKAYTYILLGWDCGNSGPFLAPVVHYSGLYRVFFEMWITCMDHGLRGAVIKLGSLLISTFEYRSRRVRPRIGGYYISPFAYSTRSLAFTHLAHHSWIYVKHW